MSGTRLALWVLAGAAALASSALAQSQPHSYGVWRNPKNSVHVEIKDCGGRTCGYVVWANADAKEDARKGGTENLVGLQLFRDFEPAKNGVLRGKVFVPDLNHTFSGTAQFVDDTTLKARGCLFANVICKSQTWRRVDKAAG